MEHVGEVGCLVAPRSRSVPLSQKTGKHSDSMFVFSIRSSYVALVVGLSNIYDLQALWKSRRWYIVGKLCALFACN